MKSGSCDQIVLSESDEAFAEKISGLPDSGDETAHFLPALPEKIYAARLTDGTELGYAAVMGCGRPEPELRIEVAPQHRRRGYGERILFLALQKEFSESGVSAVLYRTRPDDLAGVRLAERFHAVPVEPSCEAEKRLLRTYRIRGCIFAHEFSINNRERLLRDQKCGCFYCLRIFEPSRIEEWLDDASGTAVCPYCGIDSVLGAYTGFPITAEFLKSMRDCWF